MSSNSNNTLKHFAVRPEPVDTVSRAAFTHTRRGTMKRTRTLFVVTALFSFVLASVSFGQATAGNVSLEYLQTVDMQKTAAFEEGFKKHLAWRKAQGDTWRWDTWQLVRGEKLGLYYTSTDGHAWKDFDSEPIDAVEGGANYTASVGDALLAISGGMSVILPDLSNLPEGEVKAGALVEVVAWDVKPGRMDDLMQAIGRYHEAFAKVAPEEKYLWTMSVNGGPGTVSVVLPRASWADFEPGEKSPDMILEEAFGRAESIAVSERFSSSIENTTTTVWMYRADMSYIPAKSSSE